MTWSRLRYTLGGTSLFDGPAGVDGTQKWSYPTAGASVYGPPIEGPNGALYFVRDYKLVCLNPNGTLKWEAGTTVINAVLTGATNPAAPTVGADGTIYVGRRGYMPADTTKWEGGLMAFNPDGSLKWWRNSLTKGLGSNSPIVGADGTIYYVQQSLVYSLGGYDVELVALNPDGSVKWSCPFGHPKDTSTNICVTDGTRIFFSLIGGNTYAVNMSDGSIAWTYLHATIKPRNNPTYKNGKLYIPGSGGIAVIDATTAAPLFASPFDAGDTSSYPAAISIGADNSFYVATDTTDVYAFNPDGSRKWKRTPPDYTYTGTTIGSDGIIYLPCGWAGIVCYNPDGSIKQQIDTTHNYRSNPISFGSDGTMYGSNSSSVIAYKATPPAPTYSYYLPDISIVTGVSDLQQLGVPTIGMDDAGLKFKSTKSNVVARLVGDSYKLDGAGIRTDIPVFVRFDLTDAAGASLGSYTVLEYSTDNGGSWNAIPATGVVVKGTIFVRVKWADAGPRQNAFVQAFLGYDG